MKTEEVIAMAKAAGIDAESDTLCRFGGWVEPMTRFAELVAEKERELCRIDCASIDMKSFGVIPIRALMISNACQDAIRARSLKGGE